MYLRFLRRLAARAMTGATVFALAAPLAHGQSSGYSTYPEYGQIPTQSPSPIHSWNAAPAPNAGSGPVSPSNRRPVDVQLVGGGKPCIPSCPAPCPSPVTPPSPITDVTPPVPTPPVPPTPPTPPAPQPAAEPSLPSEAGLALGGSSVAVADSAVGYIDSAIPRTRLRMRYDSAYGDNRPDRAEFFYPKCGCFANPAAGAAFDPKASGPPLPETSVDYQDINAYLEVAVNNRFSGFIEIPYRFLNPEVNANTNGFSDLQIGFKGAAIAEKDQYLTFQLKTYVPTGEGSRGLGTDHVSIEPGLLYYQQLSDRLALEAEFKDWIPIGGSDFQGNVLRYGVGVSYQVLNSCKFRAAPVLEMVGWTVLNGQENDATQGLVLNARGDTIINAKLGVRFGIGEIVQPGSVSRSDLYIGYGRALTGEVWYRDLIRVEYRLNF